MGNVIQEQEPRLKYERFGSDVPCILGKQAATRLCVSDKILALGTQNGTVHVMDYDGNEVEMFIAAATLFPPRRPRPRPPTLALSCAHSDQVLP